MKKIGILFGQERSFPEAFVKRVNELGGDDFKAEFVNINKIFQAEPLDYAVIIDRISQDVPFYRAALKNAAITGTAVINNPFWWSADEKFFNNALAVKLGIPVPKTALIPSHARPDDTTENSFSNLAFPFDWDNIFEYTGFPAYMKPFDGGGWKEVYKLNNKEEFFDKHSQTHQYVMMLQEEIEFDEYFRCYCIGGKYVRIMQYEPRNPMHLRYAVDHKPSSEQLLKTIHDYVIKLNQYLGYDFNTVEFAVRDGIPYAIDFCNPAPDADAASVGKDNFEWVVETSARYAIERAKTQAQGQDNLTWGEYIKSAIAGKPLSAGNIPAVEAEAAAKSAAPVKKAKPAAAGKTAAKKK
jgi:glutathione synthase/RimK-type ligase-like ATP-grasp enzyme